MDQPKVNEIIIKAQSGDPQAKNQLVQIMKDNNCMKAVGRYLRLNRLLEPDDVRSEFWVGVVLALPKVKTTIGDPLFYLSWSGVNRVKSQLRKAIGKGVTAVCKECGHKGRLHRVNRKYQCVCCGAQYEEIDTFQKEINMTIANKGKDENEEVNPALLLIVRPKQRDIEFDIDVVELKKQLTPQELRVFELIEGGMDREHEQNYLRSIALTLEVSPQCVNQYLKKIRLKIETALHYNTKKEKIMPEPTKEEEKCKRGHPQEVYKCPKCGGCRACAEEGFEYGCPACA